MCWKILSGFVVNLILFAAVKKNFENRLRFEKVIAKSLVASFFGTQCTDDNVKKKAVL